MALQSNPPITLTDIEGEYSANGLNDARTIAAPNNPEIPSTGQFGQLDFLGTSDFQPLEITFTGTFINNRWTIDTSGFVSTLRGGSHSLRSSTAHLWWITGPRSGWAPATEPDYGYYNGVNAAIVVNQFIPWWHVSDNNYSYGPPAGENVGLWWPASKSNWIAVVVETNISHGLSLAHNFRWWALFMVVNTNSTPGTTFTWTDTQIAAPFTGQHSLTRDFSHGDLLY